MIEAKIESRCDQPSFIMNHPLLMSPLAKSHAQGRTNGSPYLAERFELFLGHRELINAYSEQTDSEAQCQGFAQQTQLSEENNTEDSELHRADEEFLEALSYGMPPTAGFGLGIDRLCMAMCGVQHIREVIAFPMFRSSVVVG